MANSEPVAAKWNAMMDKVRPGFQAVGNVFHKIGSVFGTIFLWIYRLRGLLLAIPVIIAAWKLATFNMDYLPELVGLDLLSTGDFGWMVERSIAVYGPLCVTAGCLLLMLITRRTLYPWIISLFTLLLPLLILATNNFDGLLLLFGQLG